LNFIFQFNDRKIYVSPDGYVGAQISYTASNFEIWNPVGGFRRGILNVEDVRRRFENGQMDTLYNVGVNPIRFAPGRGILIWGQKTLLARRSALDRLNVRLLLIVIEPAIKEFLEDFLFELNTRETRAQVTAKIESYMDNIRARKGVIDYQVICNSTNNLPNNIDNNEMNVDLFIKPSPSIETIPFRVVLVSQSTSFSDAAGAI
jgi:phage tail sheath protein FI